MKIGYLHIGAPTHGIVRYGRLLASEAKTRPDLEIVEAEVVLTGDANHDRLQLIAAAQQLSQADIVHLQHNAQIWGGREHQLKHLHTFLQSCTTDARLVTLHDIFYPTASAQLLQYMLDGKQPIRNLLALLKAIVREQLSPNVRALRKVTSWCNKALVCTEEESRRLKGYVDSNKVRVVPHFVEDRPIAISPIEARKQLGLEGKIVITLLGFIYRGKGHDLLVKALPLLPPECTVIFAGGLGHEDFLHEVISLAEREGVRDRIRVTGYLSESDQDLYLAATHLAVCPFAQTSASGSLSTWISVNQTIIASNLPQVAEYNTLEPRAISTFDPYTSTALAEAIQKAILCSNLGGNPIVSQLRQQLRMPVVFDHHLNCYNDAISSTKDVESISK
jgi:glycosyltransferase involved in cell wall biosynthesis